MIDNYKQSIKLVILLLSYLHSINAKLEAPTITSVVQLNETSLSIKWKLNDQVNISNIKRFRLFYRNDYVNEKLNEWPGQIFISNYMIKNQPYKTYNSSSTFDCFNECIRTPRCLYVVFKNNIDNLFDLNCILKIERKPDDVQELEQIIFYFNSLEYNLTKSDDKELGFLRDYKNEVILYNLPTSRSYKFYVTVYDSVLEKWSPFSDSSPNVNLKINILLDFEQVNNKGMILKWNQYGEFRDYVISRYTIHIFDARTNQLFKKIPILLKLKNYKLNPDYIELKNELVEKNVKDEHICHNLCLKMPNCIRYAYYSLKRDCYLHNSLNLSNSYYKSVNILANSIKSEANKCLLSSLDLYKEYYIQLEYITPFGDVGYSNKIRVIRKELSLDQTKDIDIEDLILENEYDDDLFITEDDSLIRTSTTANTTATTTTTITTTTITAAITTKTTINFKTSTQDTNYENEMDFGSDYLDYESTINPDENENEENEYDDDQVRIDQVFDSDRLQVYFKINDRILNDEVVIKSKYDDLEVSCFLIGNEKIVQQGVFKKIDENDNIIDLYDKISQIPNLRDSMKITLNLHNLSKNDRGKYECGVEDYNEKSKFFNLQIIDTPSKPSIESVKIGDDVTYITWHVDDTGDLVLEYAIVEMSPNFSDSNIPITEKKINFSYGSAKAKNTNLIKLDMDIPQDTQVRLTLFNSQGLSLKSEIIKAKCNTKSCIEKYTTIERPLVPDAIKDSDLSDFDLTTEETKIINKTPSPIHKKNDQQPFNKTNAIIIVLVICILIVIIIIYIIYDSRTNMRSTPNRKKNANNDQNYDPLPTNP